MAVQMQSPPMEFERIRKGTTERKQKLLLRLIQRERELKNILELKPICQLDTILN